MLAAVPRGPLILGLAGLVPFVWGAVTVLVPALGNWTLMTLGGRFAGPYIQLSYGLVILAFMSGVLWGFATRATGWIGYALSVIPALWAFLMVGGGPVSAAINLMAGFIGVLLLDLQFWQQGLTPPWWMKLRLVLTGVVILTLLPVVVI